LGKAVLIHYPIKFEATALLYFKIYCDNFCYAKGNAMNKKTKTV